MAASSVKSNDVVIKKCGEIIITMNKNAKNVYSFNCWFCDTICIQMKKFSLHLEQEHVIQLLQSPVLDQDNDKNRDEDTAETQPQTATDRLYIPEIKIEDCLAENIKVENEEDYHMTRHSNKKECPPKYQDPLETLVEDSSMTNQEENEQEEISDLKEKFKENEPEVDDDANMHSYSDYDNDPDDQSDFSADENSGDDTADDFKGDDSGDEKYATKRTKQNTNEQEREFILLLIEAYRNYPQLWNTSDKCNRKQKKDILQNITDHLNTKLKLKLKLYMVKKKINFIRKEYEKEVERQMNGQEKDKEELDSQLFYYENMNFLKAIVENKFKLVKRKKPKLKVKPLNDDLLCNLVDIYKNYTSLWDVNHLAFTVKDKRHETMQLMLEEIEKTMNLVLDIYILEKHLNYIHKSYAKDKQLKLECEKKQLDFKPSCSYYNKCDFLELHQGPFKCDDCNEILETYNDHALHRSQHDGSIPFKCQECGMGFKKISNYTIHAKRHLRVFKFHCDICGKGYPFNAELDLHMRSHTGAQPYLCSVCGEGFRTAISYDNHIRRHEERFKYFCHICKKGFNHMTRLNDHVKAHLNVRDVICTVCGKGFTSRKYLNHHKRIHEGKNYSCNICGKSFAQDAGLRAHKKYHGTPIGISSIQKEQNKYKIL